MNTEKVLETRVVSVGECARCGENHEQVVVTEFNKSAVDSTGVEWTHWCLCPKTKEPILIRIAVAEQ